MLTSQKDDLMKDSQELKVIWVSLPQLEMIVYKRTLHSLGYACYSSADIFTNTGHDTIWKEVLLQKIPLDVSVFEGYNASAQTLPIYFYLEIIKQFPNAKFIIEDMPPSVWANRYRRLIRMMKIFSWMRLFPRMRRYLQVIDSITYPITKGITSRLFLQTIYTDFKSTIIKEVPEKQLLIFNPDEGWKPICDFLGKPEPDTPLPFRGNKKETNNFVQRIIVATLKNSNTAFLIALYFLVLISIFVYLIFFY